MSKVFNVVYDVDDVLNNLNDYVMLKIGKKSARYYNINLCDEFTQEEKERIYEMFGDSTVFSKLSSVDGADEICDIESTGKAKVWINSSNYNKDVAEIKYPWLLKHIPNLNKDRIRLQIGKGEHKECCDFADIVVEDCFTNLLKYSDKVIKILIDKTYNQAETYGTTDRDSSIIRVNSLREANELIYAIIF